ncbi:RPA-related protein RADX-like isoform X2 [Scyliorhinus canicula]|uniref:RPA-related protein RADX-like isoform X2 n=1 Tax=Scyliorhinus canicula TaxID=7830 RepID=UPI0018F3F972|nr:RPA-related protein RADX-like isoform X2 [Scyliorhinus canicula]
MAAGGCAFRAMFPDSPAGLGPAGFGPVGWSPVCWAEVLVLSVERYPRDPDSGGLLAAPGGGDGHLYDLGLSEGHCRLRAVLHPALNPLVRNNRLRSGCRLRGVRLGLEYDERRLGGSGRVFVLLEAQVVARGDGAAPPAAGKRQLQRLRVLGEGEEPAQAPELPIRARRSYYLPLWDSANYYGDTWHQQPPGHPTQRLEELNLNPRNPAAEITVINPRSVNEEWRLPALRHCFATRKELSELRSGDLRDIIGLVTFVGRQERVRSKERPDEFLVYRWLHLIDGTASEPFVLKLFSTSQPEIQAQIAPCSVADNTVTLLVCTNVRVECQVIDPSGQTTFPYLLTTEYSQVYVNGHHQGKPYVKNHKVKEFIKWIKSAKDQESHRLSRTLIGGSYSYPPLPSSERDYRREILGRCPLTTMSELKQLLNQLEYREYRQVTVQGRIISVTYQSLAKVDKESACDRRNADIGGIEEFEELFDADPSFPDKTRNKSPVIPLTRSGSPLGKQAGSSQKRRRKGRTCSKKRPSARLRNDTGSSSQDHTVTHRSPTCERAMNRAGSPVRDLSFAKACQEFHTDSEDVEEATVSPCSALPMAHSADCSSQPEHLPHRGDISQMVARRFHFRDKAFLLQTFGLQPSIFSGTPADQIEDLDHCEPSCYHGYYTVTILGLNEELSLDSIFLPIVSSLDHRAMYPAKHNNTLISILAHGGPASKEPCHIDTVSVESSPPSPGDILTSAADLEEVLFILILDICNQGGSRVEVVLNRAYAQHRVL